MVKSSSNQQSDKKLINSIMDTHTKIVRPVKSFALKSGMEFASRSSSVFNELNALEKNHKTWMSENETHDSFDLNNNEPPPVPSDVFKKPFAPVPRKRKCSFFPHRRNMKKWIKYSLKDVPISSDATNTAIALQFLDELREKKKRNEEVTSTDDKLMFRKPVKRSLNVNNQDVSTSVSDNVGLEHHSQSKNVSVEERKRSTSNIKLLHLQDDFDESF